MEPAPSLAERAASLRPEVARWLALWASSARSGDGAPIAPGTSELSLERCPPLVLDGRPDPRIELYTLGCVLYERLAGRPFGPTSPRPGAHERRLNAARHDLSGLEDEPRELVLGLLDADPDRRPPPERVARWAGPVEGPDTGEYEDLGRLGQGGMGEVRLVRDPVLGRNVALKVCVARTPAEEARFLREARAAASLQHPGVLPLYTTGRLPDGRPYYTMRPVGGVTFGRRLAVLRAGPDPVEAVRQSLALLLRVLETVAWAHDRGVLHCDLKPDNIMIGEFGEVLVIDWGLSREDGSAVPDRPGSKGGDAGTPAWVAPELLRGVAPPSPRTEVYALGAMLYEIIAGGPPSAEEQTSAPDMGGGGPLPRWEAWGREEPHAPALAALASRALDPHPEARPNGVLALHAAISTWMSEAGRAREALWAEQGARGLARASAEQEGEAAERSFEAACSAYRAARAGGRAVETELQDLVRERVRRDLREDQPSLARQRLSRLVVPDPTLEDEIRSAEAARLRDVSELASWRRELLPQVPDPVRRSMRLAALLALAGAYWSWRRAREGEDPIPYALAWALFVPLSAVPLAALALRRPRPGVERRSLAHTFVTAAVCLLTLVFDQRAGLPGSVAGVHLNLLATLSFAGEAAIRRLPFSRSATCLAGGSVAAIAWPAVQGPIVLLSLAAAAASFETTGGLPPRAPEET